MHTAIRLGASMLCAVLLAVLVLTVFGLRARQSEFNEQLKGPRYRQR